MMTESYTGKDLREEFKEAMKKWRTENPEPKHEIEPEPELPEPVVIRMDKQLLILDVIAGDMLHLHLIDGNSTRKIEMNFKQMGAVLEALHSLRKPMKEHKTWKTFYEEELNRFEYEQAAWQRQLMAFKESVKRRLGISKELE